jgi:SNF2 family DNA or RNA helicase
MKKPVKRAILLEAVLSDFLEVEEILLKVELNSWLYPLTAKQKQLYNEVVAKLRELIEDLTADVAQEHRAA